MFGHIRIERELVELLLHFFIHYISDVANCDLLAALCLRTLDRELAFVDLVLQISLQTLSVKEMFAVLKRKYLFLNPHVAYFTNAFPLFEQFLSSFLRLFFVLFLQLLY